MIEIRTFWVSREERESEARVNALMERIRLRVEYKRSLGNQYNQREDERERPNKRTKVHVIPIES